MTKVVWPYPISVKGVGIHGVLEVIPPFTGCLIIVESADLDRFKREQGGLVTAFISLLPVDKAPKVGEQFNGLFTPNDLWKINLPTAPQMPQVEFAVLEKAISLKKIGP